MKKGKVPFITKIVNTLGEKVKNLKIGLNHLSPSPTHILAIHLGDATGVLQMLPTLQFISEALPEVHIDCMVGEWNKPLVSSIPAVRDIIIFNAPWIIGSISIPELPSHRGILSLAWALRRHQYDTIMCFQPDFRMNMLMALLNAPRRIGYGSGGGRIFLTHEHTENDRIPAYRNHLEMVGFLKLKPVFIAPRFNPLPDDRISTRVILDGFSPAKPVAAICPGSDLDIPLWPISRFGTLISDVLKSGFQVLLLGMPRANRLSRFADGTYSIDDVQIWNYPTPGEIIALAKQIALYFGEDGSTSRLMAAAGAPSFILMNHGEFRKDAPFGPRIIPITPSMPCSKCLGDTASESQRCMCMELISTEQVIKTYRRYIARQSKSLHQSDQVSRSSEKDSPET